MGNCEQLLLHVSSSVDTVVWTFITISYILHSFILDLLRKNMQSFKRISRMKKDFNKKKDKACPHYKKILWPQGEVEVFLEYLDLGIPYHNRVWRTLTENFALSYLTLMNDIERWYEPCILGKCAKLS